MEFIKKEENKKERMFDFNLQLFADEGEPEGEPEGDDLDNKDDVKDDDNKNDDKKDDVKTYTEDEVQKMIKERLAREQKAKEKAIEEAEKLAKMNADEKKEYEYKKMKEELEELKNKDNRNQLSREASKILSENGIVADDGILEIVVKDNAENTLEAVNSFIELFNNKVEEGVKKALSGKPPKNNSNNTNKMTKAEILKIKNPEKRLKAIQDNSNLFNR